MIAILILMLSGIFVGLALGKYPITLKINDKLLNGAIYLLLLLLGIGVGLNDKIIDNFYNIGMQAFIIAFGAIAGSVTVCWMVYKTFFHLK